MTQIDGSNPLTQQNSKQPFANTEMALTVSAHPLSGYGWGKIVALCKNASFTLFTTPSCTPITNPYSTLALILSTYLKPAGSLSK